jgi:Zn-dependent protease
MLPNNKQLLSYLVTFAVYTALTNWKMSLLLVVGVSFHECCHLLAARYLKLPTGGFYLFPLIGGVATITAPYRKYSHQAFTVLAGPMGGGLMAALVAAYWYGTGMTSTFLGGAAYYLVFLNLFNLFPLSSMDGGQIVQTVSFSINDTMGLVVKAICNLAAVVVLWFLNPFLVGLVVFFGFSDVYSEYKAWKYRRSGQTYLIPETHLYRPTNLTKMEIVMTTVAYLGSILALGILLYYLKLHTHGISDLLKK